MEPLREHGYTVCDYHDDFSQEGILGIMSIIVFAPRPLNYLRL